MRTTNKFQGTGSIARQCLQTGNQNKIVRTRGDKECKWKITPPKARHFGGIWERIITSGRRILLYLLSCQITKDEVLLTSMCKVERFLNNQLINVVYIYQIWLHFPGYLWCLYKINYVRVSNKQKTIWFSIFINVTAKRNSKSEKNDHTLLIFWNTL